MKYETKGKQIFVFERRKTEDGRNIWFAVAVFESFSDLQNSNFELKHANMQALRAFKKVFT